MTAPTALTAHPSDLSPHSVRDSLWLPTLQLQLAQVGVTSEAGL